MMLIKISPPIRAKAPGFLWYCHEFGTQQFQNLQARVHCTNTIKRPEFELNVLVNACLVF